MKNLAHKLALGIALLTSSPHLDSREEANTDRGMLQAIAKVKTSADKQREFKTALFNSERYFFVSNLIMQDGNPAFDNIDNPDYSKTIAIMGVLKGAKGKRVGYALLNLTKGREIIGSHTEFVYKDHAMVGKAYAPGKIAFNPREDYLAVWGQNDESGNTSILGRIVFGKNGIKRY